MGNKKNKENKTLVIPNWLAVKLKLTDKKTDPYDKPYKVKDQVTVIHPFEKSTDIQIGDKIVNIGNSIIQWC